MFRYICRLLSRNRIFFATLFFVFVIFVGPLNSYQQIQNNTNVSEQVFKQAPDEISDSVLDIESMNRTSEDFFQNPRLVPPSTTEAQAVNDSSSPPS